MAADNFSKLEELLGFDPMKKPGPSIGVVDEVRKKLIEERTSKAKEETEKLLRAGMEMFEKAKKSKADADAAWTKINKELGKALGPLLSGKVEAESSESTEENKGE